MYNSNTRRTANICHGMFSSSLREQMFQEIFCRTRTITERQYSKHRVYTIIVSHSFKCFSDIFPKVQQLKLRITNILGQLKDLNLWAYVQKRDLLQLMNINTGNIDTFDTSAVVRQFSASAQPIRITYNLFYGERMPVLTRGCTGFAAFRGVQRLIQHAHPQACRHSDTS